MVDFIRFSAKNHGAVGLQAFEASGSPDCGGRFAEMFDEIDGFLVL